MHVWFKDVCRDVVNEFAPWANDFIDYRPIYDAISCGTSEGTGLSLHDHDVGSMNHWVVAIAFEVQDISTVDRTVKAEQNPRSFSLGSTFLCIGSW